MADAGVVSFPSEIAPSLPYGGTEVTAMDLHNKTVFKTGADLGLVVSVCGLDGVELARMYGKGRAREEAPDLRTHYQGCGDTVRVEALTPDGRAFVELVR